MATFTSMEDNQRTPRAFVFCWGKVSKPIKVLMKDLRKVMEPNTFPNLKITRKNTKKDILNVAGSIGGTHILSFSSTENNAYLRLIRLPRGPTLTFRILEYSSVADVQATQENPLTTSLTAFRLSPLVIMSKFGTGESHVRLTQTMFQHLFPPFDLQTTKIKNCQRTVLLSRDPATDQLEFRHYYINQKPAGVNTLVQDILKQKIDISKMEDMSSLFDDESKLLPTPSPQEVGSSQTAVSLLELGPRMTLQLVKVEDGYYGGEVKFHRFITKTEQEVEQTRKMVKEKADLRKKRQREQTQNVERKQKEKEEKIEEKKRKQIERRERAEREAFDALEKEGTITAEDRKLFQSGKRAEPTQSQDEKPESEEIDEEKDAEDEDALAEQYERDLRKWDEETSGVAADRDGKKPSKREDVSDDGEDSDEGSESSDSSDDGDSYEDSDDI
ncbi:putative Suppressor of SWI4 1 like protein [Blattamonas nauphoetae]|uniref:Suppressor of SWI4 1 like protein n=1 Tax=Blattamonas nauphoetae TaxID=2049346 RepID=A0ABQ9XPM2_9EUKA|nr:putative Suppressor of SWI4 1 like protein [Blattamonas nauphoetae]